MKLRTIREVKNIKNKRILARVDFNVPLESGVIQDDTKIKAVLPTIRYLSEKGAKVILISHLGKPAVKNKELRIKNQEYSLKPAALRLSEILGQKVGFVDDCLSAKVKKTVGKMKNGEVILLENLRFYPGEEANDKEFAGELASLAQVYINDAFAVSHRQHASVLAVTNFLPSYAGLLLAKEVEVLSQLFKNPQRPFLVIIGGAKTSTKIKVIENLLKRVDYLLLGGALVNNFFRAQGYEIGKSAFEPKYLPLTKKLLSEAKNKKIILPVDVVIAKNINPKAEPIVRKVNEVKKDEIILDIGPDTIRNYAYLIKEAKTILWNGPLGKIELPRFRHSSVIIARLIASRSSGRAYGVVGGGETIECLNQTKMAQYVDWISTGGGAMLEFLEGKILPGIKPLIK